MIMPGRNFNADKYRFGFNGMEDDDELKGTKNSYDFGARIYDPRIVRWLTPDPQFQKYPYESPYMFAGANPIYFIDPQGETKVVALRVHHQNGKTTEARIVDENYVEKKSQYLLIPDIPNEGNKMVYFNSVSNYDVNIVMDVYVKTDEEGNQYFDINETKTLERRPTWIERVMNVNMTGSGESQSSGFFQVTPDGGASPTKTESKYDTETRDVESLIIALGVLGKPLKLTKKEWSDVANAAIEVVKQAQEMTKMKDETKAIGFICNGPRCKGDTIKTDDLGDTVYHPRNKTKVVYE